MSAALDAGARDVLVKPFEPQRLASAMARALRMANTQRERDALREQVDRQAQEFNALYTVGRTISGLLNIDEILTLVVIGSRESDQRRARFADAARSGDGRAVSAGTV